MKDTGRIKQALDERARAIVFGEDLSETIRDQMPHIARIDRAHLVMLSEREIVRRPDAVAVLQKLADLEHQDFAPLRGRECLRGLFLTYEDYLIETLGSRTGGILQTARSRNDLNATLLKLRLRRPIFRLLAETVRLQTELATQAQQHRGTVMCLYTHFQPAVPATFGHYLAGVASALVRDLDGIADASADVERCPLGAGAAAGTTFPIDTARTAQLLGFAGGPVVHSLDAVASRDLVLRLLASGAILGSTLARFASDFLVWSTAEYRYIQLPDRLVGSSSLMPQKRNPFLLEHVKGLSVAPLGAFVTAATTMHGAPFTNSVAVGTEAVRDVWLALGRLTDAVVLMRLIVAGAMPDAEAMAQRAADSNVVATEVANMLVTATGVDFRSAHHLVGELTLVADASGERLGAVAARRLPAPVGELAATVDPAMVVHASEYGGGPGPASMDRALAEICDATTRTRQLIRSRVMGWKAAERALGDAVARLLATAANA